MVVLVDSNRAVKISIREWDEENTQYRPDWSADFFEVGSLQQVPDLSDCTDADLAELGLPPRAVIQLDDVVEPSGRIIDGIGTFNNDDDGFMVRDVDYCIEQANDMVAGVRDFAGDPQPNQFVDVTELDRSAYPRMVDDGRLARKDEGEEAETSETYDPASPADSLSIADPSVSAAATR